MVYLPFGSGPRKCLGERLALVFMKSGLVYFLRNHYVRICEETNLNGEFDANALLAKFKDGVHLQIFRDNA